MNITDRFIHYTSFDTQSNEESQTMPSTQGQRIFAEEIVKELKSIGLQDISIDENGYVMATLPSNTNRTSLPTVGFIAHLDTSPDMCGKEVHSSIMMYQGGNIVLNKTQNIVLSPDTFPELEDYKGQEIIVTDGTTLLGADDKAGIAAIISAMEYLVEHTEIEHGKIRIAFTPDEEIGRGADRFDVKKFGCDWAYTIDGGEIGELEYENFNAAEAKITIKGRNVHPGYAKDKMINASLIAMELNACLPSAQRPENTCDYEGFFHLTHIGGSVDEATLTYIIRDHDRSLFEQKKDMLQSIIMQMNQKYSNCLTYAIRDQYYNMREIIEPQMRIIDLACEAMNKAGVTPKIQPIRGGTDGARLSFMGLPCPNLFAGGLNFHGRYEYLPVHSLKKSMETIVQICHLITNHS